MFQKMKQIFILSKNIGSNLPGTIIQKDSKNEGDGVKSVRKW